MYDELRRIVGGEEFFVVEQFVIPGRTARYEPIPEFLFNSSMGEALRNQARDGGWDGPLWAHQALALEALGRGENVVVSSGTASGKSLIFQSLAFHKTLLRPDSKVLVFYPLKALAADQVKAWKEMARSLNLDSEAVGRIDGSVPLKEREGILSHSRIVVMTPDVCHAWLMSRLSLPAIRAFLETLSTVVMDEAHSLEGVFGSNFAFLIRRLSAARNFLLKERGVPSPLQFVAATATIKNPVEHLERLTGSRFTAVDHHADGAPQYDRIVAHIASEIGEEARVTRALQDRVLERGQEGGFITFLDSRMGVEGLARSREESSEMELEELLQDADVLPYRAGYDPDDRKVIEQRLRSGNLRGIVSTSALELGIDIPHLRVGFTLGVPNTRKAYRQRLGRVGRNDPAAFVVIAPENAFTGYGSSFREYHDMSVEPSYLYLDNRFMQFAHGRCLAEELEAIGASPATPAHVDWPIGFSDMHAAARPGGNRAPEFDAVAALGGDTPHYGYPLRNVCELSFKIQRGASGDSFGEVNQLQALRECYPGATYYHLTKAYEVAAWHTSSFDSFVRVKPTHPGRSTRPRIRTWINASISPGDMLGNHLIQGANGFLCECQMQITEKVEGYTDVRTGAYLSYQNLQSKNPNMRARSRNFRTTGIVLCIESEWFKETARRRAFGDRLREIFLREHSIIPQDVGSAASNISVRSLDGGGLRGGCIAIYDETYGSLRLTERVYLEFESLLKRLASAIVQDPRDGEAELQGLVRLVGAEVGEFSHSSDSPGAVANPPNGHMQVFTSGSRVCYREAGPMGTEVEIVRPTMMDGNLMYQVKVSRSPGQEPARRWVSASKVEPSAIADAWSYANWNVETEEYEDPQESDAV